MGKSPLSFISTGIYCKGKFIYWLFDKPIVLFNTLGMTGWWVDDKSHLAVVEKIKHNHVSIITKNKKWYFNDYRNFGTLMVYDIYKLDKKLNSLGPDLLDTKDNYDEFLENLKRKNKKSEIGIILLDQKVLSGCGNYLRAEALYFSKINHHTPIWNMKVSQIKMLWNNLRKLAWIFYDKKLAVKNKIIVKSDPLYKITDFTIYMNDFDPNGNPVIKEKLGQRTIHWVPKIQI